MYCHRQARGVWLLPLIEGLEIPPDLFHVRLVGFGCPYGRMQISTFQYSVRSAGVCSSRVRLHTRPDLRCCIFSSPPVIRHQGTAYGSRRPPHHVLVVAGFQSKVVFLSINRMESGDIHRG